MADQISDAILDRFLAYDPQSKVACETLVTTGQVFVAGEVKSDAYIDLMEVARGVISRIGYTRSELKFDAESCGVLSALHEQSQDINRGVERAVAEDQGAGDQGMMFGYACNETSNYMPLSLDLSHMLLRELSAIRREGKVMTYLRPDSKSQVTVEYDEQNHPVRIHTIVISTQHDHVLLKLIFHGIKIKAYVLQSITVGIIFSFKYRHGFKAYVLIIRHIPVKFISALCPVRTSYSTFRCIPAAVDLDYFKLFHIVH